MKINGERLVKNLKELGSIGYVEGKGTNRMAYSAAFFEGRSFVEKLMQDAGMETRIDSVGNLIGTFGEKKEGIQKIAVGSHIDTVPNGGMYDGCLGVLSGIELVKTMNEAGYKPNHQIEIIAFNEEEGNVIGGTFGSKAFAGSKLEEAMIEPMKEHNMTTDDFFAAKVNEDDYRVYLEYHIEQGGILENKEKTIGIVEAIFGILRFKVTVNGITNHAGSTPMYLRDDAMEKSAHIISQVMDMIRATGDSMVGTVGKISVEPGAVNVIPGKTEFIIELRDKEMKQMYEVIDELKKDWQDKGVTFEEVLTQPETKCDERLREMFLEAAEEQGYSNMKLYSGAGHDLMNMALIAPSALLFIPSKNGVSHHKDEYSSASDIEAGANVLLKTLLKLDGGEF